MPGCVKRALVPNLPDLILSCIEFRQIDFFSNTFPSTQVEGDHHCVVADGKGSIEHHGEFRRRIRHDIHRVDFSAIGGDAVVINQVVHPPRKEKDIALIREPPANKFILNTNFVDHSRLVAVDRFQVEQRPQSRDNIDPCVLR